MKKKQVRLSLEELHEIKWLMGGLLTLLSLWSLWALNLRTEGALFLATLAVCLALLKPMWVASMPSYVWRMAAPFILVIILLDFGLSRPDFLPPLVRMVIFLLIYRTLAPRGQREDLQLVLLCLFCLVISGVLTVSLLFAFQILLFTPLAMALLFIICFLDTGPESQGYHPTWEHFRRRELIARLWRVMDFKVIGLGGVLFAFVVALSSLLFILMPRFDLDQAIPFLKLSAQSRAGFSENVRLGEVTDITLDSSVALRIDVPSIEAVETFPYWRMLVLDEYRNGSFALSPTMQGRRHREYAKTRGLDGWGIPRSERRGELWTFYLEGGTSRYLPVAGPHTNLRFSGIEDTVVTELLYLRALDQVRQSVVFYQIEDMRFARSFPAWPEEVRAFEEAADPRSKETASPTSDEPIFEANVFDLEDFDNFDAMGTMRVRYPMTTLALNLSEEEQVFLGKINSGVLENMEDSVTLETYSERVKAHLQERFTYSLRPDGHGGGQDPVVNWLKEGTRGHCELFSGAFILLAREAGFPARMVVGFAGGSWNQVEGYFVVRNEHAHAWVEVYDPANRQWMRVDPTPGNDGITAAGGFGQNYGFESGWNAWLDSLRIQWYRRIVNFEQEDQIKIADGLLQRWRGLVASIKERATAMLTGLKQLLINPLAAANLLKMGGFLALCVGVFVAWWQRYLLLGLLFRAFKRPEGLDPVRRQASRYLRKLRVRRERFQPDLAVATEGEAIYRKLEALRFGPATESEVARPVFKEARQFLRTVSK